MIDQQSQWHIRYQQYLDAVERTKNDIGDDESDNERASLKLELHSMPCPDLKACHEKLMLVINEVMWCPRGYEYDDDKNILSPIADILLSSRFSLRGKNDLDFAVRLLEGIAREENVTPDGPQGFIENGALAPVLNDLRRLAAA